VAASIGLLWPRLRLPLALAAAAIALSRIVINAHFLGDVIGGAAIGAATVWLLREAYAGRRLLFEHAPDGTVRRLPVTSAPTLAQTPTPEADGGPGR
jgi:membrane-associated phospholipid phosphatase